MCWLCCAVLCRLLHVSCKVLLKHLPADSQACQQQWPLVLALTAGYAVDYAKEHLNRYALLCSSQQVSFTLSVLLSRAGL